MRRIDKNYRFADDVLSPGRKLHPVMNLDQVGVAAVAGPLPPQHIGDRRARYVQFAGHGVLRIKPACRRTPFNPALNALGTHNSQGGRRVRRPRFVTRAAGVPFVQPRHGSFSELVEATGGGLLYDPTGPEALATAIARLMDAAALRRRLADQGRQAVQKSFTDVLMADQTWALFERYAATARV